MEQLSRLRIATKLWVFIVLVLVLLTTIAGVGLVRSAGILAEGRARQDIALQLVHVTTQWNGLTETNAVRNSAIILSGEPGVAAAFKEAVTATSDQITVLQKKLESLPITDADRAQLAKIADFRKPVIELRDKARKARADGNVDEALKIMNTQYLPAMGLYIGSQKELVKMQEQHVVDVQVQTESRRQSNSVGIVVGLVVVVVLIVRGYRLVGALYSRPPGPGQCFGRPDCAGGLEFQHQYAA